MSLPIHARSYTSARDVASASGCAAWQPHSPLTAALPEGNRSVLGALVRVMDHRRWAPIRDGLLERIVDQRLAQRPVQRPSDDLAAPGIQDHRKVQETGPRRDVGDVGNPQLVRPTGREVALHQIGRRTASRSALWSRSSAVGSRPRYRRSASGAPHACDLRRCPARAARRGCAAPRRSLARTGARFGSSAAGPSAVAWAEADRLRHR